ncbi:hypothetical protein [Mesorhizobium sp. L2C089B000]|uniref:hypothetical protein n=1 Tax=Mesorhizobium sp. L2C089B000 TaxID=1287120 RepID=UPI0012EC9321|nr:hypothetical protein [Mesorhizobium sp. L2C089B000]
MCVVSSAARADALDDAKKRVAELVGSATIAPDAIELFVGRDVLKTIVDRLGEQPLTANLASRRIDGQIVPGRSTYLEFRSDPSIEGSLTISSLTGNWADGSPRLVITAQASAHATAHLKAMLARIGSPVEISAAPSENISLSLTCEDAEGAWFKGAVSLDSPEHVSLDIHNRIDDVRVSINLPTDHALSEFVFADPLKFNTALPGDRKLNATLGPESSKVGSNGITIVARPTLSSEP